MRLEPWLAATLILVSGCAGQASPTDAGGASETAPINVDPAPSPTEPNNTFVPKFHTHDYWSGRSSLILFGPHNVRLGQDLLEETYFQENGVLVGATTFDTKTDGEDVSLADKTDVVYQGTSRIEVTFKWRESNELPGVSFYFKPANTPTFTLLGPVQNGQTYRIDMKPGWADMPHQLSLSRWKFRLEAYNPATAGYPYKVHVARGEVEVSMTIFNGGERFIDPPHPYFFTGGPVRYAGEVNRTFSNCVYVNNTKLVSSQPHANPVSTCALTGLAPDAPHIVPWETTTLVAELWYNHTGATSSVPHALGLMFHASDGNAYKFPKAVTTGPGYVRYEIGVTEAMSDSPYATQTDWRFALYPIVADQKDYGGDFSGNVHLRLTALKEGDTSGRGM